MDALTSLAMYSDSDEEDDEEMHDANNNNNVTELLSLNLYNSPSPKNGNKTTAKSMTPSPKIQLNADMVSMEPPSIPSSPDLKPNRNEQENVVNLLKKYKNHTCYLQATFKSLDFEENPRFITNTLSKFDLFDDNKMDEYKSEISLSIFNPINYFDKEDNVDTLMKLLEDKIRENQRRIKEKRERKEKEKQILREKTEKRIPERYNVNVLNAAKQAVLAKKNQFRINSKRNNTRWDDKK